MSTLGFCLSILLQDERKGWLIKAAFPLVREHSKCSKLSNSKQMYGKVAPYHCQPSPPMGLPESTHWFDLFLLRSLPTIMMWYKVICMPEVTEGKSNLEPAEHECEGRLKWDLCGVAVWEMLMLILSWHKFPDPLCSTFCLIPGDLGKWFPGSLQSEKKK